MKLSKKKTQEKSYPAHDKFRMQRLKSGKSMIAIRKNKSNKC